MVNCTSGHTVLLLSQMGRVDNVTGRWKVSMPFGIPSIKVESGKMAMDVAVEAYDVLTENGFTFDNIVIENNVLSIEGIRLQDL